MTVIFATLLGIMIEEYPLDKREHVLNRIIEVLTENVDLVVENI